VALYALLLSRVSTFHLDSGFETPGKNFHIFVYWKSNLELVIIVIQVLTYSGEKSSLFQVPTWPRILHKIENNVHVEHNFRKLIVVKHTVYDKTTWPRPSAILLTSGYQIYSNFEPCDIAKKKKKNWKWWKQTMHVYLSNLHTVCEASCL
jgi:hypothetical protein